MYPCLPPRPCGPRETDPYSNAPIPTGRPVSLSPGIRVSLSPGTRLPQRWLDIYDPVRDSTPGPLFPCFPAPLPPRIQFPFHSHETVHGHTCSLVSMSTVLYLSNGKNPRIYPCFLLPLTGLWRAAELVQIVRTAGHSPTCFPVAPYTCSHVPKETKATNRPHNLVTRLPVALSLRVTVSRFPCSRAVPISYGSPSSSFRLKLYTRFPAPLCPGLHGAKANCHCWQKSAILLVSTFPGSHAPLSPCLASTGRVPEHRPQMRHPQNRSPVCRYTCKQGQRRTAVNPYAHEGLFEPAPGGQGAYARLRHGMPDQASDLPGYRCTGKRGPP
jgi:hypothetical protein